MNLERMKVEEMSLEALSTRWDRDGEPKQAQQASGTEPESVWQSTTAKEKTLEICMQSPGDFAEC